MPDTPPVPRVPARRFRPSMRVSIWIATAAVALLILVLAVTIHHARERDLAAQYGSQMETIVKGAAAGIEDLLAGVEKSMLLLSRLPGAAREHPDETPWSMRAVYLDLEGKVRYLARLDETGAVLAVHPPFYRSAIPRRHFQKSRLFREIRRTLRPFLCMEQRDRAPARPDAPGGAILVGVPRFHADDAFSGVVFASVPLDAVAERYLKPVREEAANHYALLDGNNAVFLSSDPGLLGKTAEGLGIPAAPGGREGRAVSASFLSETQGRRSVVAHAPFHVGAETWTVAIIAPYDIVISLVRRTFFNILLGAGGLIVAVVIAGASVARAGQRRLRMQEELKRLRERESWRERLLREKKTMEGILGGSPIPAFVIDRNHRVILWNRACAELTGHDARDMIGTDRHSLPFYPEKRPLIADLIVEEDLAGLETYYGTKRVRKSQTIQGAYEAWDHFVDLGGRSRHLYFLAAPIRDERGQIIAAIETLQDVSPVEELTRHLRESAENLQNELAENIRLRQEIEGVYNYLQSIVESLPERLFDLSSEGIIHYVSRGMRHEGGTPDKIRGKHFTEFVAPEHREFIVARWEEAKRGVFKPYEIEATARDGTKRNLLITMRPVKKTDRFVIVQRDITEFKTLEKNLYESQKLAAVGQLSAGIAHELRNALSPIKMSLQILEKRLQPQGNDLRRFRIAQREVDHLEALVNDVLIFAKPAEPKRERADIHRLLEHALTMVEKAIQEKQIQFRTVFAKDMPPVWVDPAMLGQALLNVCRNAVEAMESHGILTLATRVADNEPRPVVLEIRDTGCGIAPEDLPHLFNPFFTRKRYGTGLGLSQAKKIIDLHDGAVEIHSRPGEGTTVRISLPAGKEA